jgi:hypothetical protein
VVLVSAGQANDAPVFEHLLANLRVDSLGGGRPGTRPQRVRADKAYSSRAIRTELRCRGMTAVTLQLSDQMAHRNGAAHAEEAQRRQADAPSYPQLGFDPQVVLGAVGLAGRCRLDS